MSTRQLPTVSVVIAAFSSERWDYLQEIRACSARCCGVAGRRGTG